MHRASQQDVQAGWTDLAQSVATGGVVAHVPAGQRLVMQVSDDAPLQPRVVDRSTGAQVEITGAVAQPLDQFRHTYWIEMRSTGSEAASALLSFGGVPRRALGRLVTEGPAVSIAPVDYRGLLRAPDRASEILLMSRDEQSQLVGAGWSRVAADAGGGFRWMTAPEARVLLPVARAGARRIRIQAFREANGPASIRLALNGTALPWQPLQRGWQAYEWALPEGCCSQDRSRPRSSSTRFRRRRTTRRPGRWPLPIFV